MGDTYIPACFTLIGKGAPNEHTCNFLRDTSGNKNLEECEQACLNCTGGCSAIAVHSTGWCSVYNGTCGKEKLFVSDDALDHVDTYIPAAKVEATKSVQIRAAGASVLVSEQS